MRVLIGTVTAGNGHLAAAAAIEEAWRGMRPGDVIEKIDLLTLFSPLHRKIYSDGYIKLVERAPELWGMVFAKTDNPKLLKNLKRIQRKFPSGSKKRFARAVKHFKPDVVLCTHYLPLETLTPLFDVPGTVWFSLQPDDDGVTGANGRDQARQIPGDFRCVPDQHDTTDGRQPGHQRIVRHFSVQLLGISVETALSGEPHPPEEGPEMSGQSGEEEEQPRCQRHFGWWGRLLEVVGQQRAQGKRPVVAERLA